MAEDRAPKSLRTKSSHARSRAHGGATVPANRNRREDLQMEHCEMTAVRDWQEGYAEYLAEEHTGEA